MKMIMVIAVIMMIMIVQHDLSFSLSSIIFFFVCSLLSFTATNDDGDGNGDDNDSNNDDNDGIT